MNAGEPWGSPAKFQPADISGPDVNLDKPGGCHVSSGARRLGWNEGSLCIGVGSTEKPGARTGSNDLTVAE
jgi:hypothetical protein